jgi:ABC-type Fe3+/spermidine/putrescine transport system ATPase subunit
MPAGHGIGASSSLEGLADVPTAAGQGSGRAAGQAFRQPEGLAEGRPRARQRVAVFFRPDQPRLAEAAPGRLRGRVVSSRFLGGVTRLVVGLDSSDRVKLELPGGHDIRAGVQVGLELGPESLVLFEEPGGDPL